MLLVTFLANVGCKRLVLLDRWLFWVEVTDSGRQHFFNGFNLISSLIEFLLQLGRIGNFNIAYDLKPLVNVVKRHYQVTHHKNGFGNL